MKRNVLEYAASDKFIWLFLTADGIDPEKLDGVVSVSRDSYDPEMVKQLSGGDDLGVPDQITCSNVRFNLDNDDELHASDNTKPSYSFFVASMQLFWFNKQYDDVRFTKHRDEGPAHVEFKQFSTVHTHGKRVGFSLENWKFNWYQHGEMMRAAGPYSINGDKIDATVSDDSGTFKTRQRNLRARYYWNKPSGGNINESRIQKVVDEHEIKMNRFHPGASVFDSPTEELIFYNTV